MMYTSDESCLLKALSPRHASSGQFGFAARALCRLLIALAVALVPIAGYYSGSAFAEKVIVESRTVRPTVWETAVETARETSEHKGIFEPSGRLAAVPKTLGGI